MVLIKMMVINCFVNGIPYALKKLCKQLMKHEFILDVASLDQKSTTNPWYQSIHGYLHTVQFHPILIIKELIDSGVLLLLVFFFFTPFLLILNICVLGIRCDAEWIAWRQNISMRLVICIWIIYLVQRVLARATSQSDSDAWLQQLFVSVPLLFKHCFSFSFLFRHPLYYILLVAIWDLQLNHNHAKSLWST